MKIILVALSLIFTTSSVACAGFVRKLVFVCALLAGFFPVIVQAQENPLLDNVFWKTATVGDVVEILDSGVGIDVRGEDGVTPLHFAVGLSSPEVISLLLDRGADIDAGSEYGATPLHLAAGFSSPEVISLLLDRGADVNTRGEYGTTPLHMAARFSKKPEVVELLLDGGANAKSQDSYGVTPFDLIKGNKHLQDTKAYRLLNDAQYQ